MELKSQMDPRKNFVVKSVDERFQQNKILEHTCDGITRQKYWSAQYLAAIKHINTGQILDFYIFKYNLIFNFPPILFYEYFSISVGQALQRNLSSLSEIN